MDVYTIADDLGALSKEEILKMQQTQKKKRKNKVKEGFKKFGRGLATVFLAPARGAFYAFVALNINGLASKLKWIYDNRNGKAKEGWKKITQTLKKIGVLKFNTFLKSINTGSKKKAFFISKKQREKFAREAKKKGIKAKGINAEIGFTGAEIGAIIGSSAAVVAALIPVVVNALKKGGQEKAAEQTVQEGKQMLETYKTPEQFGQYQAESAGVVSSEQPVEEFINGTDLNPLFQGLSSLANVGLGYAAQAIERKAQKNPKLKRVLDKGSEAVENYAAGQYLRKAGAIDAAKDIQQVSGGLLKYAVPAAILGGIFLFTRKK